MSVVPMSRVPPSTGRREWCGLVAMLCAPGMQGVATEALVQMIPALAHFPDYLFTADTAREVATRRHAADPRDRQAKRDVGRVPAFDEIARALNAYRKAYVHEPRPALPAPPEPERRGPTEAEQAAVAAIMASWRQERAATRPADAEDDRPALKPTRFPDDGMTTEQRIEWRKARGLYVAPEGERRKWT